MATREFFEDVQSAAHTLQKQVPGLTTFLMEYDDFIVLRGRYECPCGEISQIAAQIHPSLFVDPYHVVETMKEQLRRHVISEGNTPNF